MSKINKIINAYKSGHDYEDLAIKIGMTIPPQIQHREKYFQDNVSCYSSVLERDVNNIKILSLKDIYKLTVNNTKLIEYLAQFTDTELFGLFGYYVLYSSRKDLIDNLVDALFGLEWSVVLKPNSNANDNNIIINRSPIITSFKPYNIKDTDKIVNYIKNMRLGVVRKLKDLLSLYLLDDNNTIKHIDTIISQKMNEMKILVPWQIHQ
jgi:hypothetical protein